MEEFVADHGGLRGLRDNDHPQYILTKGEGGAASDLPTHGHTGPDDGGSIAAGGGGASFSGARVHNSIAQSIADNTVTSLTFDSERFDTDGYHSTTVNTSRLTAPQAGYYLIGGTVYWASNATGQRQLRLFVNGTTMIAHNQRPASAAIEHLMQVQTVYFLNANDYVELQVYQNRGGALNSQVLANSAPEFYIALLGI